MGRSLKFLPLLAVLAGLPAGAMPGTPGIIELISKADPTPDSYGAGFPSAMSADGRYVVFVSDAPNLFPGQVDGNASYDIFLRDRAAGTTALVSHAAGKPNVAGNAGGRPTGISSDGRYVAFISGASDVVAGVTDTGFTPDVFLFDRVTGNTTLISHAGGDPATTANGASTDAQVSADGNYVVFVSEATDLVTGQTAPPSPGREQSNVYLHDRRSGSTTLLSHASGSPTQPANGGSGSIGISANGAYVAFGSTASDLLPGLVNPGPLYQVFLYERSSGALTLVSHAAGSPLTAADGGGGQFRLSSDGRWVAFASTARNLVAGQTEALFTNDAFLYDRTTRQTRLVSFASGSPQTAAGIATAAGLSLSADGRYLVFVSPAANLVEGQANLASGDNVFVFDRVTGKTALVSHHRDSPTTTPSIAGSVRPSLSADGRYIAFASPAADLVPRQTDPTGSFDVFVYDQTFRTIVLASHTRASASTAANGSSDLPLISADGGVVAFTSYATDLGAGQVDANGFMDAFAFERKTGEVTALSQQASGLSSLTPVGPSSVDGISADGRFVLFVSQAAGVVPGQVDKPHAGDFFPEDQGTWDVFLRDRATGKTTLLSRSGSSGSSGLTAVGGDDSVLSADGKFAAFRTYSASAGYRLLLYDRTADTLTLVNHAPGSPAQSEGLLAYRPALSADGRYIAYTCDGCRLVPGQPEGDQLDVFLYDRVTGSNTLVSHASGLPATPGNGESLLPRISADGRFVAFISSATDLVAGQGGATGAQNAFVFDRTAGTVALVSHTAGSATTPANHTQTPYDLETNADGRWIVYQSNATDLVPGQADANGTTDVFLYDRASGTHTLVSHAASSPAAAGDGASRIFQDDVSASLSDDGRWIVFQSTATDLVPGLANPDKLSNVYLHDRTTGLNTLISSVPGAPGTVGDRWAGNASISSDGSRITFYSPSSQGTNLFVQERATGARTLIGRAFPSTEFGYQGPISLTPRLSADGRRIAFTSDAVSFVPGDFNHEWDAYLYDAAPAGNGPVAVAPCLLFDTRRAADRPALRSNARKVLTARGVCGVPATASRVTVRVTALQGSGQGNLRLYLGDAAASAPPVGILRFGKGETRSATFDLPLAPNGTLAVLPFVRGNGTVHVAVEINGYTP